MASIDGNTRNWYTRILEATRNIIRTNVIKNFDMSITKGIDRIMLYIRDEFFEYDQHDKKETSITVEKIDALKKFNQLQICKMCDINPHICEFEEYYYQYFHSNENMSKIADMLYQKLARRQSSYFLEKISENRTKEGYSNTLGARIR